MGKTLISSMLMNKNKAKQISTQGLSFFYNLNIEPLANEYKQCCQIKRKTEQTDISLSIVIVICVIGAFFKDGWSGLGSFFVIIFLIVYSTCISSHTRLILSEFENRAIIIILNYFEPNFTYLETDTIEVSSLKSFGIYPDFDSKENTGSVFGRYKKRNVQMSSISLQKSDGEGNVGVFDGLVIIVNIDNEFDRPVVVSSKYFFNTTLYIHSENDFKVHPLITTSFVEHLYRLEKRTGVNLTISINAGLLLISIPTALPNLSFYWQDLRYDFNNIMECMQLMFDVLDMFQLDMDHQHQIDDVR